MHTFDLVRGKKVEIAKQGLIKFLVHEWAKFLVEMDLDFLDISDQIYFSRVVRSYILNKELIVISV